MVNYYQILGVAENASIDEIKAAFKKLAVQFHPDKHQGDTSMEDIFKELNNAYQVLSNPYKRTRYDMSLKYGHFEPPTQTTYRPPPRPPFRPPYVKKQKFTSRENLQATFYAFLFAFTVALFVKTGIWVNDYVKELELKKVLAERRETFNTAKDEYRQGRLAQSLRIMDDMGRFMRSEIDMRDYKDQLIQRIYSNANIYFEQKNYTRALKSYRTLSGHPISSTIQFKLNRADCHKALGQIKQAAQIYNELYLSGYRNASFYYKFGKLYEESVGDYDRAIRYYEIATNLSAAEYEAIIGKAYTVVIDASMIPKNHYDLYMSLTNAYYVNEQYEKCIKFTEWTKLMWPDSAFQFHLTGKSHEILGHVDEACFDYQIVAGLDPEFTIPVSCI